MSMPPSDYAALPKSERRVRAGASLAGPADPAELLLVSVRLRRRPDAPPPPEVLQPGRSAVSREEFASRYGASEEELDQVVAFAAEHGLRVQERSAARRTVVLSGTVEQVSAAFAVELGRYESDTESYRGREGPVYVPARLAGIIEGVFGLDNRLMARPGIPDPPYRAPDPLLDPVVVPLTPRQVGQLYDFPSYETGRGQTIGLIEFGKPPHSTDARLRCGYLLSDIDEFFAGVGLTTPTLTDVPVDGVVNSPPDPASGSNILTDRDWEVVTDIDVAGSIAQDAAIAVYFAPFTEQGWVDVITKAIHDADNQPSVLSISWGWPEMEPDPFGGDGVWAWSPAAMDAVSQTFQEAAWLGVSVFASSGDQGSACGVIDGRAHVLYPASDPWVTCCGGTTVENVDGSSFMEAMWNNEHGATGGGVSDHFPRPWWQAHAGVPASVNPLRVVIPGHETQHIGRGIPDVAGNADPDSGYMLTAAGIVNLRAGTSAVCPLYAGLIALINESLGGPAGYLNPTLYALKQGEAFRDINDGATNAYDGAPGYTTGPGWDACTGLGSINGKSLQQSLLRGIHFPPMHAPG